MPQFINIAVFVALFSVFSRAASDTPFADTLDAETSAAKELPLLEMRSSRTDLDWGGQNAVVIPRSAWTGTGKSLADVIAQQTGVQTRKFGGLGSFQTVSLRGVSGNKVLVYLDDTPLNSDGGGAVDLGKINPTSIEKIVVYKGFTPSRFGGNSLGGMIHLISRQDTKTKLRAEASYGSFNTRKLGAGVSAPLGENTEVSAGVAHVHSDNDFKYLDRNNTPNNREDDAWAQLQNGRYTSYDADARLEYHRNVYRDNHQSENKYGEKQHHGSHHGELHLNLTRPSGGIPGKEGHVTKTAGFENPAYGFRTAYRFQGESPWLKEASLSGGYRQEQPRYHWTKGDGLTWSTGDSLTDVGSLDRSYDAQIRVTQSPLSWMLADLSWMGGYQTLEPKVFHDGGEPLFWENNRTSQALTGELNLKAGDSWMMTGAGRLEKVENHSQGGNSINGVEFTPSSSDRIHYSWRSALQYSRPVGSYGFKASLQAARMYRLPSLLELYGGKTGLLPNPNLKPETGTSYELNLESSAPWFGRTQVLTLVLFHNRLHHSVYYVNSAQLLKPLNLDASRTRGLEASLALEPLSFLHLDGGATWQSPRNTSKLSYEGNLIPDEPQFSLHSGITLRFWKGASLEGLCDYHSEKFRDPANLQDIPPLWLFHLKAGYKLGKGVWKGLRLGASLENILDTFYEDAYASYPYPGRQIHFNLQYGY